MDKLSMETPNLTLENVEKIEKLFPNCVKETEDEEGNKIKKIDFDLLRAELWDKASVEWLDERYRLDWPWKKRSILKANTPITKTLRPVKEDSVDWNNTQNLYIEWDNFEVLKILQESYLWQIKCIYIDPPYNTGNDFIYKDDFSETSSEYKKETEESDEWYKMVRNIESNWRFHSDRLSMMFERLKIARDLLTDDWVIFISIDENEYANLKKLWNEIFWEPNFIATLKWKKKKQPSFLSKVAVIMEYIVIFSKDISKIWKLSIESLTDSNKPIVNSSNKLSTIHFPAWIRCKAWESLTIKAWLYQNKSMSVEFLNDIKIEWWRTINDFDAISKFRTNQEQLNQYFKEDLVFITKNYWFRRDLSESEKWWWKSITDLLLEWGQNQDWSNELKSLFEITDDENIFDNPKPVLLIKNLIKSICTDYDTIMDFYWWSSTTAQAVLELDSENEEPLHNNFIIVQYPEVCEEWTKAYKLWYKNICEIWKERIRRAAKKIKEETNADIDYWFRVYRVDESCMKDVYYHPSEAKQENLSLFTSNIKEDRTPEDLLTQVILNFWLTLDLPIEEKTIWNNKVFYVAWNSLIACFDENIDDNVIDEIAKDEPIKLVFRDACFKNDAQRINVENKVKRVSPETIIKVI